MTDSHFAAMRARNVAWVPTLMPGGSDAACEFAAAMGFSAGTQKWMREALDAQPATVARAHAAGEVVEVAAIRGVSLLDRGDIDAAIAVFRHGFNADPGREHGFLPIMLTHAGRASLLAGDFPAARGHLDQALQIAQTRSWAGDRATLRDASADQPTAPSLGYHELTHSHQP